MVAEKRRLLEFEVVGGLEHFVLEFANRFGDIEIAGRTFNNISGRFKDGKLEHLFSLPADGDTDGKAFVATLDRTGFTIRDRDGIWLCADVDTCARQ